MKHGKMGDKFLVFFVPTLLVVILIIATLLLSRNSQAGSYQGLGQSPVATDSGSKDGPDSDLEKIASRFRSLRKIKGQFSGGTWNEDVDSSMGLKRQLMIELEKQLVSGAYSKKYLVQLLGVPDATVLKNGKDYDTIMSSGAFRLPKSDLYEFLVYYWRGTHDYLFFVLQQDKVVGSGWIRMLE